jgi:hypothetical protein
MVLDNKSTIFLILVLSLAVGLIVGYSIGVKSIPPQPGIIYTIPAVNNAGKIKAANINLTAKEAYNIALGDSRLWPEDTYLSGIEISSKKFDGEGKSNGWKIMFYSKLKNKTYEVTIKDGESRGTIEKEASGSFQTLKGEMIDSTILAKSFYALYPSDTDIISLRMYYDESNKKFSWTIFFSKGSHTIDAEI